MEDSDPAGFRRESCARCAIRFCSGNFDRHYRSLLVTSAAPADGKTTTAANLAAAHAEQGQRTLLIDGDLRRPSVHRNFNLPSVVGLSNALLGRFPWREAVIPVAGLPRPVRASGGRAVAAASADLVGRGLMEMLDEAATEYDLVIVDAPPLLGFAEPLQMATAVDGVLVVARAGTDQPQGGRQRARDAESRPRAKIVGLVLNEVHRELSDSYYYYDYYRSYYRTPHPEPRKTRNSEST